ncbi:MAG: DUF1801 domain-containing protein [Acidimicrobiales bacterium]
MNSQIEGFFASADQWPDVVNVLRKLVLAAGLVEEWKWRQPCYTHNGKNVVMIAPFAEYCALAFFQGVLLTDHDRLLVAPGKDSQSARQLRFTSSTEVAEHEAIIAAYLTEAMGHVDAGTRVEFSAKEDLELPVELVDKFDEVDGLEEAFMALTPGRQRGFVLQISGAKQSSTRNARVEKHIERIMAGKGIHDCICGKSGRMPRCDGSHAR